MAIAPDDPVFDIATFVDRLNAVSGPRRDGKPRWNRWKLTRLLQDHKAQLVQAKAGGKYWLTPRIIRDVLPDFYEELLDQEALRGIAA